MRRKALQRIRDSFISDTADIPVGDEHCQTAVFEPATQLKYIGNRIINYRAIRRR